MRKVRTSGNCSVSGGTQSTGSEPLTMPVHLLAPKQSGELRIQLELEGLSRRHGAQAGANLKRSRMRPPLHIRALTHSCGTHDHIDYIVVDENRTKLEFVAKVERFEQSVIDDGIAQDALDSAGRDLGSERFVAAERIGGC